LADQQGGQFRPKKSTASQCRFEAGIGSTTKLETSRTRIPETLHEIHFEQVGKDCLSEGQHFNDDAMSTIGIV